MGSFVFKWPYPAADVHVTGTFDDWAKSEQLNKVGDVWEKEVLLPSADEKVLYKFVVDDQWIVDENAPKEGDGHNNTNNVLLPEQIKRREITASAPGAFPETPSAEQAFSVQPIPASSGHGNPIKLAPGEPIPSDVNKNTVDSTVTTSQEDYEKFSGSALPTALGAGAAAATVGGIAGATAFKKPESKDGLIPESSLPMGVQNLETLDAGPFISSSGPGTTTAELASKVPLEKSVDPTISSAAGGSTTADLASKVPLEKSVDPTISSVAPGSTTAGLASKVPLEKPVDPTISSAAPGTSAAALAATVPVENKRQGMVVDPKDVATTAVPETVQQSIGQAHKDPEAAASAEAVKEKSAVEKELLGKVKTSEATGQSASAAVDQSSYHGLATTVPKTVEESMAKADAPPEAAADASIVAEKTQLEQELLQKTPLSNESGQPAPTLTAATSATAPTVTGQAAARTPDVVADSTLADEPAVRMMTQNETTTSTGATNGVAPATVTAAATGVPTVTDVGTGVIKPTVDTSSTPSTPAKKAAESAVVSPASTAGTDKSKKKHKHRLSTIIKNIFHKSPEGKD